MYHVMQGINVQVCVRLMEPGTQSSDVIEVINYKNEPVSIHDYYSLLKLYNTLRKDMKLHIFCDDVYTQIINIFAVHDLIVLVDSCNDPTPHNGNTAPAPSPNGRYPVNSHVTISCDAGFTAHGNTNAICQDALSWHPEPPACRQGD